MAKKSKNTNLPIGARLCSQSYKILDIIGHGGYGKTYLVENRFGDKCVVKEFFMSTYCTRDDKGNVIISNPDNEDIEKIVEEQRNKFEKEAITIRSLNHPNIIKVHNLFFENNTIYYVMPYVEGGSLKDKASKKPLPEQRVRKYLNQILDALEYMHNKGICHLDIKPGNIMLANDGETVVLIDFGTSKVFNSQSMNKTMMSTTTPPFTPGFASAEQENGKVTDLGTHSDIYSLGATLLFLLTGDVPDRAYEFNQKPFPQLKGVSQSMYNTIRRAMAYWVKDRINSIAEFRELLSPPAPYTNSHKKTDETKTGNVGKTMTQRKIGAKDVVEKETSTKQIEQARRKQQANILGRLEIATSSMSSKVKQMCNGCNKSLFTLSFLDRFKKNKAFRPGLISVLLILVAVISIVGVVLYKSNRGAYKFEDYSQNDTIIGVNGDTLVTSPEGDTLSISPREEPPLVILPETKISFKMIYVKGGTFKMGAQSTDPNGENYDSEAWKDEQPVHSVTLDDYYIGETEVTQELWETVMGTNPSEYKYSNRPVENVSWHDCQDFIRKLNQLTGKTFRLPTEAEWEYAARGGNKSRGYKYVGSDTIDDVAWYGGNSSSTHLVGTKSPNELGLYDMSGNVWEWCSDLYGDYPSSSQTNPNGSTSGSDRVLRGGSSWAGNARCRVASRTCATPNSRNFYYGGFRLVCDRYIQNRSAKFAVENQNRSAKRPKI